VIIKGLLSLYSLSYPTILVYMLQACEYQVEPYLKWYWRTKNFNEVMKRRHLELTRSARSLLLALRLGMTLEILVGVALIYLGIWHNLAGGVAFGAGIIVAYPVVWAHMLILPLLIGRYSVSAPATKKAVKRSEAVFAASPAIKIAVAGSYGKTTMKELLRTVLSQEKIVAATPANKNVSISHAHFAAKLKGDEEILIIEYGEGAPGDVARFSELTHPTHGVITGLAPAHLDKYKSLKAAGEDIFSLADYLKGKNVYVNGESSETESFLKPSYKTFSEAGALGWKTRDIEIGYEATRFSLVKANKSLELTSGLIGRHQISYLAFVSAFALELGLSHEAVIRGIAQTLPFEHRMQPYQLADAWIIDDTYNGNIEGIRAGTRLLAELPATRKIYVTPGLVDQGEENERVHKEIGKLIAGSNPDLIVLMQNSVTDLIQDGLNGGKYKGEVRIESNPLDFYTNLNHFVASGDLVMLQNDWTDNYA